MDVSFRSPKLTDLVRIAEIYNFAVRETAATFDTEEKQPEYFTPFVPGDQQNRMLVAEVMGQVVAYGGTYPFSRRAAYSQLAELMIYVDPDWQKQGIGTALLQAIHNGRLLDGLYTVLALVNSDNTYMHRILEGLGYTCRGQIVDVALKFNRRHSLTIFQRDIPAQSLAKDLQS